MVTVGKQVINGFLRFRKVNKNGESQGNSGAKGGAKGQYQGAEPRGGVKGRSQEAEECSVV
jgi:hypothetical protein